ncbi:hypothetical protein I4U23_024564 [Adineta vaga]|nr:hypothetical protein I4U23_024564 [Adineta vaga]
MFDKSISDDCWYSIINLTNSTVVRQTTGNECRFSRIAGTILLIVAINSLIFNIYSLKLSKKRLQMSSHDRTLIIGMFISSLCVTVISTPSVITQCFLCHQLCSSLICRIEGFNSFFNGCATMHLLVSLSIVRYVTTANSPFSIHFQHQIKRLDLLLVFICFLTGSIWSIPPMFSYINSYVPEGLGFHCGLNWFNRSLSSRTYFFLLFLCVYFIPITIMICINFSIQRTIHRLTRLYPNVLLDITNRPCEHILRRHISKTLCDKSLQRLQHLYEDRRFVIATGVSVVIYLIAWTPYSIVALSQLFGRSFSLYKPWIMTICAFLAKISIMINPTIYTILIRAQETIEILHSEDDLF